MSDKKGNAGAALLTGFAAGAAAGLLFAPKSGKESREKIKDQALKLQDKGVNMKKDLKDKATEGIDKMRETRHKAMDKVDETASEVETKAEAKIKEK